MVDSISGNEAFETVLQENNIVVVDFYAAWCGPCRFVAPAVEDMAKDYAKQVEESAPADAPEEDVATKKNKIRFIKIDVDTDSELATKLNVTAMPTFMVFTDGELTKAIVGANVPLLQSTVEEAFKGIV